MSVNPYEPHVFVLPEDDANRQLADGFHLEVDWSRQRQMQVLRVAKGWRMVLDLFKSVHVNEMDRNPNRFMVLLIDLDGHKDRLDKAKGEIPNHLAERVFILATLTKPERLTKELSKAEIGPYEKFGSKYEKIGSRMAEECRKETDPGETAAIWNHRLLRHNAGELDRLREYVRPILFQSFEP